MTGTPSAFDDFALTSRATPLAAIVADEVRASGPITFARFMALALGHPEHGYYARPGFAWGAAGDFQTSPEVAPVFGYLWARQVLECWERLGRPAPFHLVEVGAGSGAFSEAMLTWLRDRAPECFAVLRAVVLDAMPRRIDEQRARLERAGFTAPTVEHASAEAWLARDERVTGVIISNECFDALPVHIVERRVTEAGETLHEWLVALDASGGLTFELGAPSTPALAETFARLGVQPGEGCRAEVCLAAPALMRAMVRRLDRGYVLSIDYGHDAASLYASWRRMGTLMAFRQHSPQPDPLASPGLLDLTAHVDLTTLAEAARAEGCEVPPHVSQAEALIGLGIGQAMQGAQERAGQDFLAYANARRAAETLLDPTGLGRIRVLVAAKDAPADLACLSAPMP